MSQNLKRLIAQLKANLDMVDAGDEKAFLPAVTNFAYASIKSAADLLRENEALAPDRNTLLYCTAMVKNIAEIEKRGGDGETRERLSYEIESELSKEKAAKSAIEKLQAELDAAKSGREKAESELNAVPEGIRAEWQACRESEEKLRDLRAFKEKSSNDKEALSKELAALSSEVENMRAEAENWRKSVEDLKRQSEGATSLRDIARSDFINSISAATDSLKGEASSFSEETYRRIDEADRIVKSILEARKLREGYGSWFASDSTPLDAMEEVFNEAEFKNLKTTLDCSKMPEFEELQKSIREKLEKLDAIIAKCEKATEQDYLSIVQKISTRTR